MKKLSIAIVTGGNVAERDISLKSAFTIYQHLDPDKYQKFIIELNGKRFSEQQSGQAVDLNGFSLQLNGQTISFDLIFLMLHGHPAEDGCLQGYFETLGIAYTGCDPLVSALTFNKQLCKDFLKAHHIPMAPSVLLHRKQSIDWATLEAMRLPLFIKPNKNGSSYGVSKVTEAAALRDGIALAFDYDDEVIVEEFVDGREFSNGVFRHAGQATALPVTEIIPENEFFDYKAKYENESQEVTPAQISDEMKAQCQALSLRLYQLLGCKGMVRFDYIFSRGTFYFLEANTIPGMSEQSIVPQQTLAHGWSIGQLLDAIVDEATGKLQTVG